jgi:hypothetical protein
MEYGYKRFVDHYCFCLQGRALKIAAVFISETLTSMHWTHDVVIQNNARLKVTATGDAATRVGDWHTWRLVLTELWDFVKWVDLADDSNQWL